MSQISFEYFGELAEKETDYTLMVARYKFQEEEEKRIIFDLLDKLHLTGKDKVLDLGCGAGNLLLPLSFFVKEIVGLDHASCIKRLLERSRNFRNIRVLSGNFLEISCPETFDKIVCYSVVQYLADKNEVEQFILKALTLLVPGGLALFGDIPNQTMKQRFLSSEKGQKDYRLWREAVSNSSSQEIALQSKFQEDSALFRFDDVNLLEMVKIIRSHGYNVYLLPQPEGLPFSNSREDILVQRLK